MENALDKIKALLYSGDETNMELAKSLSKSQKIPEGLRLYQELVQSHSFWKEQILSNFPESPAHIIPYFKEQGFDFFKIYTFKEIPEEQDFLIPFIKEFKVWYLSLSSLPKGLERFTELGYIHVGSGDLKSIDRKVWQLPKLWHFDCYVAGGFKWEGVEDAQQLTRVQLTNNVYPSVPDALAKLPKLEALHLSGYGNPKDAKPLPNAVWDCTGLVWLELRGKPFPLPPPEMAQLQRLRTLEILWTNWEVLPEALRQLPVLHSLNLSRLIKLKRLPDWFAALPLKELHIRECKFDNAFEILSQMPQLEQLTIPSNLQKKISEDEWKSAFEGRTLVVQQA